MEKYVYDKSNGLWYKLQGDCFTFMIPKKTPQKTLFILLLANKI